MKHMKNREGKGSNANTKDEKEREDLGHGALDDRHVLANHFVDTELVQLE